MEITHIRKRDFSVKPFDLDNITNAVFKALRAVNSGTQEDAQNVALAVYKTLMQRKEIDPNYIPTIEQVQDIVENKLMETEFHEAAKAYILYRNERALERKTDIFEKRVNLKPYEYPQLYDYVPAIRHSYWIHTEYNFTSDIQDFKSQLTDLEQSAIKNTMLAISQIEIAVKSFWGDLYHRMPKPEIGAVGSTFAESEVRHADAYSHLIEILGLNAEFKALKKKPVIMKRVQYLETALRNSKADDNQSYAEAPPFGARTPIIPAGRLAVRPELKLRHSRTRARCSKKVSITLAFCAFGKAFQKVVPLSDAFFYMKLVLIFAPKVVQKWSRKQSKNETKNDLPKWEPKSTGKKETSQM
jgi:ribonucleoside-diphosphate reductase beta chain